MVIVAGKKQGQRDTIVDDQRDMDIGKAAYPLVESEYVCGELKTKTPSVSSLNFREIELCTKYRVSERLCTKVRDFKLMYEIDGNKYLEGTRCSENDLKSVRSRYFIFEFGGGYESVTGRRKFRCREREKYLELFQGHQYFTSSEKVVFERSTFVSSISLGYQIKRKKEEGKKGT